MVRLLPKNGAVLEGIENAIMLSDYLSTFGRDNASNPSGGNPLARGPLSLDTIIIHMEYVE